jgi:hypothetical protein
VRHFERFVKTFSEKWRLFIISEAFMKIKRLFEDIFREMVALIRKLSLFQRLRCFLKTFSMELRLFKVILGFSKNPRLLKIFP